MQHGRVLAGVLPRGHVRVFCGVNGSLWNKTLEYVGKIAIRSFSTQPITSLPTRRCSCL